MTELTDKLYKQKINILANLLKSQIIYDHLLDLMGIQVKNRLPKEEKERRLYDLNRTKNMDKAQAQRLYNAEKKSLETVLSTSILIRKCAQIWAGTDYGVLAPSHPFEENIKKAVQPKPYVVITHKSARIPADKVKDLSYC